MHARKGSVCVRLCAGQIQLSDDFGVALMFCLHLVFAT